jgi:hypothetical protein
VKIASISWG